MDDFQVIKEMLPFLIPVLLVEIALIVIALLDLVKREHVRGGNKVVWALLILFVQIIGPVVYLIAGRQEKPVDGD